MNSDFLARSLCASVAVTLLLSLFGGCAYHGTIVRKQFRPLPFPDSLGIEGFYDFEVRDRAGVIHRQIVTSTVFARYQLGEYFDDLKWTASLQQGPAPQPWIISPRLEEAATHYRQAQPMENAQPLWLRLQDGFQ